jgi:hypothetical protein
MNMNKVFTVSVLAMVVAGTVFGQEGKTWYNSYAEGIDQNVLINVGLGFGSAGGYKLALPSISASVDFKLPTNLPITIGGIITFADWLESIKLRNIYGDIVDNYDLMWHNIGIGVRTLYHFNFLKNFDTYAGLTLGYVIQTLQTLGDNNLQVHIPGYEGVSFFLFEVNIGARYFFTKSIGAYLETGYSELQFMSIGLAVKL